MSVADEARKRVGKGMGQVWLAVLIILIVVFVANGFYMIQAENVGVILRFGKYTRTTEPGLHVKLPFVERVYKVAVERQLKEEFGFRTVSAGIDSRYSRSYSSESIMLTGDLNVAVVEWIIQYRIDDPYKYLFKVRNPRQTLRDMSEAVMREIVGDRTLNEILTIGRQEISLKVESKMQDMCDQYENGIRIKQVVLRNVDPPDPVKPSFNEVNQAQQDREKLINQAVSEYNKVIPKAKGQAQQTIQQAEGYATERINRAKGDVARFTAVFEEYSKAPEITRKRMYLETMGLVLPKVETKYIIDEKTGGILPLLDINK